MRRIGVVVATLGTIATILLGPSARHAHASERVVFGFDGPAGEHGVPAPWSFRRWSPVTGLGEYEAVARVARHDGTPVLCVKSVRSGFLVGTSRAVDVAVFRAVSWSWRAAALPKGGSFRERATNDQALQVLFAFDGGKVVSYIWDTIGPVGATGSGLSWQDDVRVIVLQAGTAKLGLWVTEQRSLYDDYRKLFGTEPPPLKGPAVQSNSQHTDSSGAGCVGPITLIEK
jgi:hypothetical protein